MLAKIHIADCNTFATIGWYNLLHYFPTGNFTIQNLNINLQITENQMKFKFIYNSKSIIHS